MARLVVTAAALVTALAVGVMTGTALAPSESENEQAPAASAEASAPAAWVDALADAASSSRLEGARVLVLSTEGVTDKQADSVRTAVTDAGAQVVGGATLGGAWWAPEQAAFRRELAEQLRSNVVGAQDAAPQLLLQHAIAQALLPSVTPPGAAAPQQQDLTGATPEPSAVLLDVLTKAGILSNVTTAPERADAIVVISAQGPTGGGTIAVQAASAWELYAPATEIVVLSGGEGGQQVPVPATAAEAIAEAAKAAATVRPSVVVTSVPAIADAQVVTALAQQIASGTGNYGDFAGLALLAEP